METDQNFNLAVLFMESARRRPNDIAVRAGKRQFTRGMIASMALKIAVELQKHGIKRGSRVAIERNFAFLELAATFAVGMLGATWIPASASLRKHRDSLGVNLTLCEAGLRGKSDWPAFAAEHNKALVMEPGWFKADQSVNKRFEDFEGYASPDDCCCIVASSGTTGTPKLIPYSHRLVHGRYMSISRTSDIYPGKRHFIGFPVLGSFWPEVMAILLCNGTFLAKANVNAPDLDTVLGSPQQLTGLFQQRDKHNLTRPLSMVIVGGGRPSPALFKTLQAKSKAIRLRYGSTEAGTTCTKDIAPGDPLPDSTGAPVPGSEVQIVDGDTVLPPGETGEVRVRSNRLISGYLIGGDANSLRDGWFYPGDLGSLTEAGELVIEGRIDDVMNIGGIKVNAQQVDQALEGVAGVADGAAFADFNEAQNSFLAVLAVLEPGADMETVRTPIIDAVNEALGRPVKFRLYSGPSVPRNENGKVMRKAVTEMASELTPVELANRT